MVIGLILATIILIAGYFNFDIQQYTDNIFTTNNDFGKKTNIARGSFSCRQLMADLGMKYPATLIFLDWYCEDPESAIASICCSGG